MKNYIKPGVVLLLSLSISACNSVKPNNYIPQEAVSRIDTVETFLIVDQDEVYADINGSHLTEAAGGGLLFAIIDSIVESSQTKSAENSVEPIRDYLIDYDYASVLHEQINVELTDQSRINIQNVELERALEEKHYQNHYEASNASAILFLLTQYRFTPDFNSIETIVEAQMYPISESLKEFSEYDDHNKTPVDLADNIYHNTFSSTTQLASGTNRDENLATITNNIAAVKEGLDKNAKEIALNLKLDIQKLPPVE